MRFINLLLIISLFLSPLILLGPIIPISIESSNVADTVIQVINIDSYVRDRELAVSGLRWDLAKTIVWADPSVRKRTPFSIVYIHGFSASRRDISPVIEQLAYRVRANVFYTRLTAHGLDNGNAFASVKPQDWIEDAREALGVGRRIGDKVILIGTSTGAVLALEQVVENAKFSTDLAALIMLSPSFAMKDWRAKFISGPLGPKIAQLVFGPERSFPEENKQHGSIWTHRYRSEGIAALMDLYKYVGELRLSKVKIPTLVLYTSKDELVDVDATRSRFAEIGSSYKRLVDIPNATRHELTGNALAPETVPTVIEEIVKFLSSNR